MIKEISKKRVTITIIIIKLMKTKTRPLVSDYVNDKTAIEVVFLRLKCPEIFI